MTQSLSETMTSFAGAARPLRTLTKEQLFIYPKADDTESGAWKYLKEAMHRRAAQGLIDERLRLAKLAKNRIEERLKNEREIITDMDKQNHKALLNQQKRCERELADLELESAKTSEDRLTDAEVRDHYRKQYLREYEDVVQRFKAGNLFAAQAWGFDSFLTADKGTRDGDEASFQAAQLLATLADEEKSKDFCEIQAMYHVRIMPSIHRRGRFLDEDRNRLTPGSLSEGMKNEFWSWWRSYNHATIKYQWADDSGIAYDPRAFNPDDQK